MRWLRFRPEGPEPVRGRPLRRLWAAGRARRVARVVGSLREAGITGDIDVGLGPGAIQRAVVLVLARDGYQVQVDVVTLPSGRLSSNLFGTLVGVTAWAPGQADNHGPFSWLGSDHLDAETLRRHLVAAMLAVAWHEREAAVARYVRTTGVHIRGRVYNADLDGPYALGLAGPAGRIKVVLAADGSIRSIVPDEGRDGRRTSTAAERLGMLGPDPDAVFHALHDRAVQLASLFIPDLRSWADAP